MPNRRPAGPRSQSAMEYLMTYGWAILIIAVVLGALYSLGVFNTTSLQPKVPGGGCHVFRPNGPGTSWNVNLVGSCNNALPQYTAQFDGQSSYISMGTGPRLKQSSTIFWWAKTMPGGGGYFLQEEFWNDASNFFSFLPGIRKDNGYVQIWAYSEIGGSRSDFTVQVSQDFRDSAWHSYAVVFSGGAGSFYLDGKYIGQSTFAFSAWDTAAHFSGLNISRSCNYFYGGSCGSTTYFGGTIANAQIYNASLSANQVKYLYSEGIGGVPISPQYLVGWWPLNGDTLDYSGNGNNGVPANVIYDGSWTSGYYH